MYPKFMSYKYLPSLEYCAGFFDGEGSVMIRYDRRCDSYILKVAVASVNIEVIEAMKNVWGGSICHYSPRKSHHSGWSEWYLQGGGAEPFLKAIRPYSLIKGTQIDLGLELLKTRIKPGKGRPLPQHIKDFRLELKNKLHALKTKGHGLRGAH